MPDHSQDNLPESSLDSSLDELPNASSAASSPAIKLDQFLKWSGAVQTGGEAKLLIQSGEVKVNGKMETRRGRKLMEGDRIAVMGEKFIVHLSELKSQASSQD
ncbi:MAG: RNA-binding S4 domain-containing protein [Drouetiella hepatica Uher 2000/2452]|uniref:RNA-binding S4 domain-containing protein n=1 Tax=Drouetiella hepatica Uher 2000/2452 TaxID=904376 RepID=A0A951QCA8_9CYAN|nr:RNA-binding S4 domain-containing protein [Drouetiella hepatica Uher 2000/2452]